MTVTSKSGKSAEVKGNTLRVYLYVLRQGPCELREVQRGLELSTPSLASYHLDKLVSVGYVAQNERGQYYASKESPGEILDGYSKVGVFIVPQMLFVAVLFTPLMIFFGYMALTSSQFVAALVGASGLLVAAVWFETFRVWRKLSSS